MSNLQILREQIALRWAENYGIINYKVEGNKMVYYKTYRKYLMNPAYSMKHTINLDTGHELVEHCKRVVSSGYDNV